MPVTFSASLSAAESIEVYSRIIAWRSGSTRVTQQVMPSAFSSVPTARMT